MDLLRARGVLDLVFTIYRPDFHLFAIAKIRKCSAPSTPPEPLPLANTLSISGDSILQLRDRIWLLGTNPGAQV